MHLMIDTETFGTNMDAPVLQVAVVPFRLFDNGPAPAGDLWALANLTLTDQIIQGAKVDRKTVDWWRAQSSKAQENLLLDQPMSARSFFTKLLATIEKGVQAGGRIEGVWSHGAGFDLPLLRSCALRAGIGQPLWDYRLERDTRTLFELAETQRVIRGDPFWAKARPQEAHCAKDDAIAQLINVQSAWQFLMNGRRLPDSGTAQKTAS